MAWTFYNSSGEALTSFGPVALTDLDIDGGTAIGEAIVDADLFIADNGAGGTNVKVTAAEVATYITSKTAVGRATRTAGALTITSTSLTDVTGATFTLTTGAYPVAYSFAGNVRISTAGRITFNVSAGGSLQHGSAGLGQYMATADDTFNISFSSQTAALSAGSNVMKVQWKTSTGTATLDADSGASYVWAAHEVR